MITVQVGDVDIVDLGELRRIQIHLRQVPPTPEICRADEPRIHQDPDVLGLTEERGVSKHPHLHELSLPAVNAWISTFNGWQLHSPLSHPTGT